MLPDQARFLLSGDYATDVAVLRFGLDRLPIFEPHHDNQATSVVVPGTSTWTDLGDPWMFHKEETWTRVDASVACQGIYNHTAGTGVAKVRLVVGDVTGELAEHHWNIASIQRHLAAGFGVFAEGLPAGELTVQLQGIGTVAWTTDLARQVRLLECLPQRHRLT